MKTILLINADGTDPKYPRIPLKKVEKYYLDRGDKVIWDMPIFANVADEIWVSCIFTWNKDKAAQWEGRAKWIGGSGYDMTKKLPPEIDAIKLYINYGFTTQGCIRKCSFCFVPKMEGDLHIVGDLYDLWDGKSKKITLLDNNILGNPEHFKKICQQARDNKLELDFNQGLDARLLTDELVQEIKKTRINPVRFAFDDPKIKPIIEKKLEILKKYNIKAMWYVLVGFNSSFEEELSRVEFLIKNNQRAYVMRHERCRDDKRYVALSRWCNSPLLGKGTIAFSEYINNTDDGRSYKKYFK